LQAEQHTTTISSHTGKQDIGISFFRKRNVFNRSIACSTLAILEVKFLVTITPNGMFSYVSPCYGGRASDKFIFNNCAFDIPFVRF
jgi:hypothetical protein